MRYTEVCNVKISEGRQGKIDNAEMQETCHTFAEKLGGNDMNEKQELVIRTLSYLEEHLQETLSLQTVAQLMPPFICIAALHSCAACGCMIM